MVFVDILFRVELQGGWEWLLGEGNCSGTHSGECGYRVASD